MFHLKRSLFGQIKEYWNRFLTHDTFPVGVVAGPANVLPREWKRAWHACYTGDEHLMAIYRNIFKHFENLQKVRCDGKTIDKALACFKHAMVLDGVITSDYVAGGTPSLSTTEKDKLSDAYHHLKSEIADNCPSNWVSTQVN